MAKKWLGKKQCDICQATESINWYDAKTIHGGRWAFMCESCWKQYAIIMSVGPGVGQKYDGETLIKIGG